MDTKLMEKLQKVLNLARNAGTEEEAATAAAILQKMLTEHNLSIADLERRGSHAAPAAVEQGYDLGKAAFRWKLDLARAIAHSYYCLPMIDGSRKTVSFIGRPDNVESLRMLYGWLIGQVQQIARTERQVHHESTGEHVDPLRWQIHFGTGCVERLATRLDDLRKRNNEDVARNEFGDVVALALHHDTENQDFLERVHGYRTDGKLTKRQQERQDRIDEEQRAKAEWLARDPEGYYAAYPGERPEALAQRQAERAAMMAKWRKEEEKREKRNAARRARYMPRGREREYDPEDDRRDEQAYRARESGRAAAEKINLQPFLSGDVPVDAKKRMK
jgi:hypothetical protein